MAVKYDEFSINDDQNINDLFNRKYIIEYFNKLIMTSSDNLVIAVNAPWGTGKSSFIEIWKNLLDNNNEISYIYYDAWKYDFFDNPLLTLIGSIKNYFEEIDNVTKDDIKKTFIELGNNAVTLLSNGIVNPKQLYETLKDNPERNMWDSFNEINNSIESIKNIFIKLREKNNSKKMIIFVDELDRCKPPFSIKLLEIIKHFFNIDGFYFVIMIDREQLISSIKHIYGNDVNTSGYLKKFIDINYTLPHPNVNEYINFKIKQYDINYDKFDMLLMFLNYYIENLNFSLREINKLFVLFSSIRPMMEFNKEYIYHYYLNSYLYSAFLVIHTKYDVDYQKLIYDKIISDTIQDFLKMKNFNNNFIKQYESNLVMSLRKILEVIVDPQKYNVILNNTYFPDKNGFLLDELFNDAQEFIILNQLQFIDNIDVQ